MDAKLIFLLMASTQWKWTHSVSVSGEISEDLTFIHKTFPVPPSIRAIIEVDVYDTVSFLRPNYVMMGIYTTNNHVNIKKQCTHTWYGQLRNSNLHFVSERTKRISDRLNVWKKLWAESTAI